LSTGNGATHTRIYDIIGQWMAAAVRAGIVDRIIRFETELFKAEKISSAVLAATVVMSNKRHPVRGDAQGDGGAKDGENRQNVVRWTKPKPATERWIPSGEPGGM
jgi:hypothetical protein